jgi:hypothetical protein
MVPTDDGIVEVWEWRELEEVVDEAEVLRREVRVGMDWDEEARILALVKRCCIRVVLD